MLINSIYVIVYVYFWLVGAFASECVNLRVRLCVWAFACVCVGNKNVYVSERPSIICLSHCRETQLVGRTTTLQPTSSARCRACAVGNGTFMNALI